MGKRSSSVAVRLFTTSGALLAATTLAMTVFCASRAEAIPAFSREHKTECTTCHTIFPQLNEFGQAFEKNGFVWPGAAQKVKRVKVTQSEEERKSAEFIKLSGTTATLPISLMLSASYLYDDTKEDHFDQKFYSAQILAAGALAGDLFGFWFNESLGNQSTTATNSLTGPSQVWAVARDPLGIPVHLKFGRFSPDTTLWKATLNGRPISAGYTVDSFSWTGAQSGLELTGFLGPRVQAVVGINDRNNATGKDAKGTAIPPNSVNEYYGRVGVKFGGADFNGKEPDVDLDKDSVWDYLSIQLSAFGYGGSMENAKGDQNEIRYGIEAEAAYKKVLLMLGATLGENDTESDNPLKSTAFSTEVDYVFNPIFALALRYDVLDVDGKDKQTRIVPGIIYAPLQSFKFRLNATVDSNPTGAAEGKAVSNTTVNLSATLAF